MNSINSAEKQIIFLSLLFIQNDRLILAGITLLFCVLLCVLGVVLVQKKRAKKAYSKANQYVNDDTAELPDLSRYDLQNSRFIVEEDITFVHTNKNGFSL